MAMDGDRRYRGRRNSAAHREVRLSSSRLKKNDSVCVDKVMDGAMRS